MSFQLTEHIDAVERKLAALSNQRAVLFAAWCCDRLWIGSQAYLQTKLGDDAAIFESVLTGSWAFALHGRELSPSLLDSAESRLKSLAWDEEEENEDWNEEAEALDYFALQAVECVWRLVGAARGSARDSKRGRR